MHTAFLAVPRVGRAHHDTLREGLIAGALGATGVAAWLLVVDAVSGRAFNTPMTLGYGLFSFFGTTPPSPVASVAFYTLFHYAAFAAVGLAVVGAIHESRAHPSVLALMLILFMCFQVGFYGVVAVVAESRIGGLAWLQVGLANLVATALMGAYVWRTHPLLGRIFGRGLVSDDPDDEEGDGAAAR